MKTIASLVVVLAAPLLLSGCPGNNSPIASSSLTLGITDAAVDEADAVFIRFTAVELLDAQGRVAVGVTLPTPQSVDVLAQQAGAQFALLNQAGVAPGVYPRLRLVVDPVTNASCQQAQSNPNFPTYIVVDGTSYPLVIPGGNDGGLTLDGPIEIVDGEEARYTVDFDLRKSVRKRGNSGCYSLDPDLRLVRTGQSGTLSGSVPAALLQRDICTSDASDGSGAAVYVYSGSGVTPDDIDGAGVEPVSTSLLTRVGSGGQATRFTYTLGFLPPGPYTVAFSCQAGQDEPDSSQSLLFEQASNVSVGAGQTTSFDFDAND